MTDLPALPPETGDPVPAETPEAAAPAPETPAGLPAETFPVAPSAPAAPPRTEWLTSRPVFGLVMLVIGLLLGYVARPFVEARTAPAAATAVPADNAAAAAAGPQQLPRTKEEVMPFLIKQTRHFRGSPNAPVTLIEFADFQCPFCGQYAAKTDPQLEAKYVQAGKLRIGYQHFAFLGDESGWAAEASECAGDQGKFWEYHDYLFSHQNGENGGAFVKANLEQFAGTLGLNQSDFKACLESSKYAGLVASQTQLLQSMGVQSTPTFILNGQGLVGAQEFGAFSKIIDQALGQ